MSNHSSVNSTTWQCFVSLDFEPQAASTLPPAVPPIWIGLSIINSLAAPVIVGINVLIIWTVLEDERLRSTSYNIMLAALALTDVLVGLIVQPVFVALNVCLLIDCPHSCPLAGAYYLSSLICCCWSLSTLTVISVERYLAIEHPLYYHEKVTVPKVLVATVLTCTVLSSLLVVTRLLFDISFKVRQMPVAGFLTLCCFIILVCVSKVYATSLRQKASINALEESVSQEEKDQVLKRRREFKTYFCIGIVVLSTVILYAPSLVTKVIVVSMGKDVTPEFKFIGQFIWVTSAYMQSLANPIIVSLRLSYIRKGVFNKMLCKY